MTWPFLFFSLSNLLKRGVCVPNGTLESQNVFWLRSSLGSALGSQNLLWIAHLVHVVRVLPDLHVPARSLADLWSPVEVCTLWLRGGHFFTSLHKWHNKLHLRIISRGEKRK
jgi:hypothetical protein